MVFSSQLFLFYFLPAVLLLYYAAPGRRAKHLLLAVSSYVFYGWSNPLFVLLLFYSTLIDWLAALVMVRGAHTVDPEGLRLEAGGRRSRRQRGALVASLVTNLGLLGFFKYFNFGVDSVNAAAAALGFDAPAIQLAFRVTLPLGISFYTFQSLSYTIDVYRGHTAATRSLLDFACYVSMFPQLVAGPIVRYSEVADQLKQRTHSLEKCARGVSFVALGLAKKVLLANPCGQAADLAFGAASIGALDAWFGATAYAFQIYFDFSGYSDMAIGLGLMFGFVFPKNFDSPYVSQSITEFWHRWHISLSTWLRDYLYLPLGGNRKGATRTYVNLFVVMLLGGLWHGAAWNFVLWGAWHGALLALERLRGRRAAYGALPAPFRVAVTFMLVVIGWVFFRASTLTMAGSYLASMFGAGRSNGRAELLGELLWQPYYVVTLAAAALITWTCPQTWDWTRTLSPLRATVALVLFAVASAVLMTQAYNPFIYFIF